MNRAEKFEDEKRRIIESCFSKKDPDGSQIESYITHIRITEDGQYPSNPPPPSAAPENKKPRVIIVAVRKSGRVRVHKARENNNGSFSIGKTWNLDDLTGLQSYTHFQPSTQEEQQHKTCAADTGFIVSLGKNYYWQAASSREKDFFIGSLVKIFRKYTGGRLPELVGFSVQEQESLLGGARTPSAPTSAPRTPVNATQATPPIPSLPPSQPKSPYATQASNREGNRAPSRNGYAQSASESARAPSREAFRSASRERTRTPSRDRYGSDRPDFAPRKRPSEDQMSAISAQVPPLKPRPQFSGQSSQSSLPMQRSPNPTESNANGLINQAAQVNDEALRKLNGIPFKGSSSELNGKTEDLEPRQSPGLTRRSPDIRRDRPSSRDSGQESLPERRRPPFLGQQKSIQSDNSRYVTPVGTPGARREESRAPSRGSERSVSTKDEPPVPPVDSRGYFPSTAKTETAAPPTAAPSDTASLRSGKSDRVAKESPAEEPSPISPPPETPVEEHRPGLGPMIKKRSGKDIANQFRKAAAAANAFKPRAGGAGQRLMAQKEKSGDEPDGITGVVPAPLFRGMSNDSPGPLSSEPATPDTEKERPMSPAMKQVPPTPKVQIQRKATEDVVKEIENEKRTTRDGSPEKPRSRSPGRRRRQLQDTRINKYCAALGFDAKVLEGRGGDFDDLLSELGWDGKLALDDKIENLEANVRREIGRAQASGWLGHIEQQEGKLDQLGRLMHKTMEECDELDGLLTLYSHELNTLAEDVAYIEAQGQGLQVQTANQKLLQKELQNLLSTISIPPADLRELKQASLGSPAGVEAAEQSLSALYKALITIDPDIRQNKKKADAAGRDRSGVGVYADTELGQMRAVKEKKEEYRETTDMFLRRFGQYMTMAFKMAEQKTSENLEHLRSSQTTPTTQLESRVYDPARHELWMYNALMLFVREVNTYEWQTLVTTYETYIKSNFHEQFRENTLAWKRLAKKPTGEEQDLLFTAQEKEKESDGITATAARKLTVKRGKTVRAGGIRPPFDDKQEGRLEPFETFSGALERQAKLISEEQNFCVSLFHMNSITSSDFVDIANAERPELRRLPDLANNSSYDPDREMAKMVENMMDNMFSTWLNDIQSLADWALKNDPLQGIGIILSLEQSIAAFEETNQEYISRTLQKVHDRLVGLFHRFVDEQIRAIEDTKVKVKKRKGIISFMRVFPAFSTIVENMLPDNSSTRQDFEVRFIINDSYAKILKAMWESLSFIAKETPGMASDQTRHGGGAGDPEDKEALNYHILLIENMNHFVEDVETRGLVVLEEWRDKANHDLFDHMRQYTDAVIRRPLGKLLEFIESTEALMKQIPEGTPYTSIASRPSHSRSTARKIIGTYDIKEVKKGIETLKKRVEKHFGDTIEDLAGQSNRGLVGKVLKECSDRYADAHERVRNIVKTVYEGQSQGMDLDWRKEEVNAMFRR
ncbi:MAG: hypothetical protein Q9227_001001 [Pyrenula ochraceoflavens]